MARTENESPAGMDIATFAETFGALIVGAVLLRAAASTYSFTRRKVRIAKLENDHIEEFRVLADSRLEEIETEREHQALSWEGRRKFRIVQRKYENQKQDICSFYLAPCDNRPLPPYHPGQFLTFELSVPGQAQPVTRCYSLSDCSADQRRYRVSIKRLSAPDDAPEATPPGLLSAYFHDQLPEGGVVKAFAPAGDFCLDQRSDKPVVLVAGGVGITPIMSMLNALVLSKSQREIWLFYGVGNRSEHAMYADLQQMVRDHPNIRMLIAYSRPDQSCHKGVDYDFEGHISVEHIRLVIKERECEFYICGPEQMMRSITQGLAQHGVPSVDIRFESFGSATAGMADSEGGNAAQTQARAFNVRFTRAGKTVKWTPDAGTLLELAEANGVKARYGCRQGICGTCVARIKNGKVDYVRKPGKEPDAGSCYPCIAQPKSDVTLDI